MRYLLCFLLLTAYLQAQEDDLFGDSGNLCLSEAGLTVGYAHGEMRVGQGDYQVIPLSILLAWDLNDHFCWGERWGNLHVILEPFHNTILQPENGVETGCSLKLRYFLPVGQCLRPFLEGGAGPMYLGITTYEQGAPGFNFLDEGGAGVRWQVGACQAITLGYRFRHISHARLRDSNNGGINSHLGYLGLSTLF